jgi:transcriptional regulator with XRE-family HTH domain
MKRFSYGERDYAFGQRMLTLRTTIGLTQAGLAQHLGVSRKAVEKWEAGESYPTAEHLKALLALGVRAVAFPADGRKSRCVPCGRQRTRRCSSMSPGSLPC